MANPYAGLEAKPQGSRESSSNPYAGLEEKRIYEPGEVIPAAAESVIKTITESAPKLIEDALKDPKKALSDLGSGASTMIKTLLSTAALPITTPVYGALSGLEDVGEAVGVNPLKGISSKFKGDYMQPALDMGQDLTDKYGGWFGGPEGWGFTPKLGAQTVGRTIAEKPLTFGMDVAPVAGMAAKGVGAGVRAVTKMPPAIDAAAAATRLTNLGLDHKTLTAPQLDRIRMHGNEFGWDKNTIKQEYRRTLFDEAGVTPSQSMVTGEHKHLTAEDNMRRGAAGSPAAEIMQEADNARVVALNRSAENVRSDLTKAPVPMSPLTLGDTIAERYTVANTAAKQTVKDAYTRAFDPVELQAAGIPEFVHPVHIRNLDNAVTNKFNAAEFAATESAAPSTALALKAVREYSVTGKVPSMVPGEIPPPGGAAGSSWQSAESMRKYINGLRTSAKGNPTDLYGTRLVLDAFDETLGKGNDLLNQARKAHQDRVSTFEPQRNQAQGLTAVLKAAQNTENVGLTMFRKLFESSAFKSGEGVVHIQRFKKIFANDPEGMAALKEGAMQHLFNDPKNYNMLSPQKVATNIDRALGGGQAEIYKELFTPQEIARIKRQGDLSQIIANHTKAMNPSGTSYKEIADRRLMGYRTAGGVFGASLGHKLGLPSIVGETLGGAAGALAGPALAYPGDIMNATKARRAISPQPPQHPGMAPPLSTVIPAAIESSSPDQPYARGGYLRSLQRR